MSKGPAGPKRLSDSLEVEVTISGKPNRLKAGEMIIMPANQTHALKALEKFKMALIMIRS